MSYVNRELKFIVGCIAGFMVGVAVTTIISPWIYGNEFLVPIGIVSMVGFPVLLCSQQDMKSLLKILGIIVICIVIAIFVIDMQGRYQIYNMGRELKQKYSK